MRKIAVIGTTFVDIKGFPKGHYEPKGTNVGDVIYVHGGVARNIAEDMANIGIPAKLLSLVDKTGVGDDIITCLENAGVDTSAVLRTEKDGLGTWLAIMDEKNDLAGSISKQPDFGIFLKMLQKADIADCDSVAITIDATPEITEESVLIAKNAGCRIFAAVGNLAGMPENKTVFSGIECFICNYLEAESILDVSINKNSCEDVLSACKLGAAVFESRIFVITCSENGCGYFDSETGNSGFINAEKVSVVDSTGAGDAFFAGSVSAMISGENLEDSLKYGTHLAALTIGSSENICPVMKDFLN